MDTYSPDTNVIFVLLAKPRASYLKTESRLLLLAVLFVAFLSNYAQSAFAQGLAAPVLSPPGGSFVGAQSVSISGPPGATIFYTLDGTIPNNFSSPYGSAINIAGPAQINAISYAGGTFSAVTTGYFDIDGALLPVLQNGLILRLQPLFGVKTFVGNPAPLSEWIDLSNSGNNATTSPGNEPTFVPNGINGLPSINFSGAQYLSLPSGFASWSGGLTAFVVAQPTSLSANGTIMDLGQGSSGNNIRMQLSPSAITPQFWVYTGTTGTDCQAASTVVQSQSLLLEATQSGTSATFFANGGAGPTNATMNAIPNTTRNLNFIGQASGGGNYFTGNIAEVLLYSNSLTPSQRTAIDAYLIQKYQTMPKNPSTAPNPAAPLISAPSGTLEMPTQVMISAPPDCVIHITQDGTAPTASSPVYDGCPLSISYSQTLKAMCVRGGLQSSVTTSTYTLDAARWPAPNTTDVTPPTIHIRTPVPTL